MKLSKVLFLIFTLISGFSIGMLYGSLTLSKGSGLAGSAVVLGYGLIGAFLLLIVGIFLVRKLRSDLLKKANIIFSILFIIFIGWIGYRHLTKTPAEKKVPLKAKTVTPSALFSMMKKMQNQESPMGMGVCKPKFFEYDVLYFYNNPNHEKSSFDHTPTDSVVFKRNEISLEITYAPPYFVPEYSKIDYEILYLKALSLGLGWIEIEVNKTSGLSTWVNASSVEYISWPEFLLSINSIEIIDEENNPLRVKPLGYAGTVMNPDYDFLIPLSVKGEWLLVELRKEQHIRGNKTAWVRWTDREKFLVTVNLLS